MPRGDLGGGRAEPFRLGGQRVAIEFCRRDGKIPEVRAGARMVFIVVIEDGLHFIDETARTQWKNEVHASLA